MGLGISVALISPTELVAMGRGFWECCGEARSGLTPDHGSCFLPQHRHLVLGEATVPLHSYCSWSKPRPAGADGLAWSQPASMHGSLAQLPPRMCWACFLSTFPTCRLLLWHSCGSLPRKCHMLGTGTASSFILVMHVSVSLIYHHEVIIIWYLWQLYTFNKWLWIESNEV